jgi:hypothetical protein
MQLGYTCEVRWPRASGAPKQAAEAMPSIQETRGPQSGRAQGGEGPSTRSTDLDPVNAGRLRLRSGDWKLYFNLNGTQEIEK